jgi:hypothetical protein
VISHSFAFSENACAAFPSALVSMLELSPPLPVLLLLRVGGLSRRSTRTLCCMENSGPSYSHVDRILHYFCTVLMTVPFRVGQARALTQIIKG